MRARYYDPELIRFLNEDEYAGKYDDILNINLYAYCEGNPVGFVDPSGYYVDSALDISFIIMDIAEISANPANPWAWGYLAADTGCTVTPGATGGRIVVKGV